MCHADAIKITIKEGTRIKMRIDCPNNPNSFETS